MPFVGTLSKLLFGVAFFWSINGCAQEPKLQYPEEAQSTRTKVTVTIDWQKDMKAVDAKCKYLTRDPKGSYVGCYDPTTGTIYVVEPISFNDYYALMILGHELWHALGAEHPPQN